MHSIANAARPNLRRCASRALALAEAAALEAWRQRVEEERRQVMVEDMRPSWLSAWDECDGIVRSERPVAEPCAPLEAQGLCHRDAPRTLGKYDAPTPPRAMQNR